MFSLTKKSFLLPIVLFTALHTQCSENKHIVKATFEFTDKEESTYWKIASIVGPAIASAVVTYVVQKYNEDPESTATNKEIKKIELETKKHPDYATVNMQLKKNKAREKQIELDVADANLIKYHQDELATFLRCDKTLYTQDYCNFMATIHQQRLEKFIQPNTSQA